jgi:hypothetical protein
MLFFEFLSFVAITSKFVKGYRPRSGIALLPVTLPNFAVASTV